MTRQIILTSRLRLVPSTQALLGLEMDDMQAFEKLLGVSIPEDWPPGEYDRDAMQFFIEKLQEGGPATLIGGGYLGPPDQTGTVELGYSISERWRGQGLAQELVTALVDNALKSGATKIIAHTGSDNSASIAVLRRCGFVPAPSTGPCRLQFDYSPIL